MITFGSGTEQTFRRLGDAEREGDSYTLEVLRWAEAQATKVSYRRNDTTTASFDGTQLTLSDGESFRVK